MPSIAGKTSRSVSRNTRKKFSESAYGKRIAERKKKNPNASARPTSQQRRTTHKVGISAPHSAQKNAVVLAQSGSKEAQSHNTSLQKIEMARAAAQQSRITGTASNALLAGGNKTGVVQEPTATAEGEVNAASILQGTGLSDFGRSVALGAQGFGGVQGGNPLEEFVMDTGAAIGATGSAIVGPFMAGWSVLMATIAAVTKTGQAISKNKVGQLSTTTTAATTTIAVNTVTDKKTKDMLFGIGMTPAAAGLAVGAIGTYPFAGFIREEALQTLGFAVNTAIKNGDWEGAEAAFALQEEILDPATWTELTNQVPYANVLKELDFFYKAASIKKEIDKKLMADLRYKEEFGETDEEMYARIRKENEDISQAQREANEIYYAEIDERRRQAKLEERAEDEKYWSKILADRKKADEEERKLEIEYLEAYYKRMQELRDDAAPSKLNFGLF